MREFVKNLKTIDKDFVKDTLLGHYLKNLEMKLRGDQKRAATIMNYAYKWRGNTTVRNLEEALRIFGYIIALPEDAYSASFPQRDLIFNHPLDNGIPEYISEEAIKETIWNYLARNYRNVGFGTSVNFVDGRLVLEYYDDSSFGYISKLAKPVLTTSLEVKNLDVKTIDGARKRYIGVLYSDNFLTSGNLLQDEIVKYVEACKQKDIKETNRVEAGIVEKFLAQYNCDAQKVIDFENEENVKAYIKGLSAIQQKIKQHRK